MSKDRRAARLSPPPLRSLAFQAARGATRKQVGTDRIATPVHTCLPSIMILDGPGGLHRP